MYKWTKCGNHSLMSGCMMIGIYEKEMFLKNTDKLITLAQVKII